MGLRRIGTLLRYGRAALLNPKKAWDKSGLILSRLRRRFRMTKPQPVQGLTLSPQDGLERLLDDFGKVLPVVVLTHEPRVARIGLPTNMALDLVYQLAWNDADIDIYVNGRPAPRTFVKTRQSILRAGSAQILFQDKTGLHIVLSIDLFEDRGAGVWVSLNETNTTARALYDWDFKRLGLTPIAQVIDGPSHEAILAQMPVDVVFTWVNHADPDWQTLFAQHAPSAASLTDNFALTRFQDNGELRYSLRAVARFMPWVRHVYVVSNCAPPDWLNPDDATLTWVDHAAILPPEALPTFNSHAIETALHNIPDLSENFIYFNDDMFVMRPLDKAWFFNANGTTRAHLESYGMVTGAVTSGAPDYLNAARTSANLIANHQGVWPTQLHRHVPYALRRSILQDLKETFEQDVMRTQMSRFRAPDNISMVSFLYHHFAWNIGAATIEDADTIMVKSSDLRWRDELARVHRSGCEVMCLNEGGRDDPEAHWRRTIARTLPKMFARAAPWEKSDR